MESGILRLALEGYTECWIRLPVELLHVRLERSLATSGPPVPVAEDTHGCGYEEDPDDRRVHEYGDGEAEADGLGEDDPVKAKAPVTTIMIAAAEVIMPAVATRPLATLAVLESPFS